MNAVHHYIVWSHDIIRNCPPTPDAEIRKSLSLKVGAMEPLGFFDPAGFSKVGDKALQHDRVDVLNIKCWKHAKQSMLCIQFRAIPFVTINLNSPGRLSKSSSSRDQAWKSSSTQIIQCIDDDFGSNTSWIFTCSTLSWYVLMDGFGHRLRVQMQQQIILQGMLWNAWICTNICRDQIHKHPGGLFSARVGAWLYKKNICCEQLKNVEILMVL